MRLVCPNCDAKYEVPEDAIPETGRDVQCANCGHAWFQMRPRVAEVVPVAAPAAAPVPPAPPVPEPVAEVPAAAPVVEEPAPVSAVEVAPQEEPVVDDAPAAVAPVEEAAVVDAVVAEAPVEEAVAEVAAAVDAAAEVALPPADAEVVEPVAEVVAEASALAEDVVAEAAGAATTVVEAEIAAPVADQMAAALEPVAEAVAATADDPVVTAEAAEDAVVEAAEDPVDVPASAGAIAAAGVAAYAVDESVLAILREEAEREAQARKADGAKPLETQTDLGLEAALLAPQRGMAVVHSDPVSGDETPDDRLSARRTRLPDVEEINSTLRPSEITEAEAEAAAMAPVADGRSSFRSGFLLVMTLAILVSALYGSADLIASAVPALAGPLQAFVSFIDGLRLNLDGLMQSATVAIDGN